MRPEGSGARLDQASDGAAFLRVEARRFGAAGSAPSVPDSGAAVVDLAAGLRVEVRRFGAPVSTPSAGAPPFPAASAVALAAGLRVEVRRFGAAGSTPSAGAATAFAGARRDVRADGAVARASSIGDSERGAWPGVPDAPGLLPRVAS
jgi:hypothetical protein